MRSPYGGKPVAWENKRRHAYIPVAIRRAVYDRADGRCEAQRRGCIFDTDLEYHHVLGVAEYPNEKPTVATVQLLCRSCHNLETQAQATKARNAWKLEPERHPGLRW